MLLLFGGTITQPSSDNGGVVPGGTLTFYATGTEALKDVFHDAAGDDPWENPVTLDGNGRAIIYLDDDGAYDIIFREADVLVLGDGAIIWSLEKVLSPAPAI